MIEHEILNHVNVTSLTLPILEVFANFIANESFLIFLLYAWQTLSQHF